MKIDFSTGKVYYPEDDDPDPDGMIARQLQSSGDYPNITENEKHLYEEALKQESISEAQPFFTKTVHAGLPYARIKYLIFCLCLIMYGFIGIISFGETQSCLAAKFLLSKWVIGVEINETR